MDSNVRAVLAPTLALLFSILPAGTSFARAEGVDAGDASMEAKNGDGRDGGASSEEAGREAVATGDAGSVLPGASSSDPIGSGSNAGEPSVGSKLGDSVQEPVDVHPVSSHANDETSYFQYGVSFAAEVVLAAGNICRSTEPCILGSGGGLALRGGYRSSGPWYLGGAYELTKQDPNNLYRLATLQQARLELRYYFETGRDLSPLFTAGAGVAGYGNEWGIDTWGPLGFLGAGLEFQVSRKIIVGFHASYRALSTGRFSDPGTGSPRAAGVTSFLGMELVLEGRDPLKK